MLKEPHESLHFPTVQRFVFLGGGHDLIYCCTVDLSTRMKLLEAYLAEGCVMTFDTLNSEITHGFNPHLKLITSICKSPSGTQGSGLQGSLSLTKT